MTIGVKYWDTGASVPAAWTDLAVLQCFARPLYESYSALTALDGTKDNWRRKRYAVTIQFGPLSMTTSTPRNTIEALLAADYVRIKDTRFTYLGDSNTINFVHVGDAQSGRDEPSIYTEDQTIELISEAVQ